MNLKLKRAASNKMRPFLFVSMKIKIKANLETVLITGGSGLLGTRLSELLIEKGYQVAHLSRKKKAATTVQNYVWNPESGEVESGALESADYIIHLAGEGIIDKKWTEERKKLIQDSRVNTTNLLVKKIRDLQVKPKAFISASAIGYYGFEESTKVFSESDPSSTDFVGKTCLKWENASNPLMNEIRLVWIRIGIVLAKEGGALPKLSLPVKFGIGSALGSGKQIVPWIHLDDVCSIFIQAIENKKMVGAYNAVAPQNCRQEELITALGNVLQRPLFMPNVPSFLLRIILGKRADLVLKGNRISCEKILQTGFVFKYSDLREALKNSVGK